MDLGLVLWHRVTPCRPGPKIAARSAAQAAYTGRQYKVPVPKDGHTTSGKAGMWWPLPIKLGREPEHPSQPFQQSDAEPFLLAQQGEEDPTFLNQERGMASPEDEPSWNTVPFRPGRSGQVQNVTVSGPPVTGAKYFPLDLQWDQEDSNSKLDGTSQSSSALWQGKSRRSRPTRRKQKHKSLGRRGGQEERQECPQLDEELPQVWRSFDSLCDAIQQQDSISATERIVLDLEALLLDQEEDFPFLKRLVDSFLNALTDQLYFLDLPMISKVALYYGHQPKTDGGTTLKVTTANVTSWRKQVLDWHCASKGEILLVQETHLHGDDFVALWQLSCPGSDGICW